LRLNARNCCRLDDQTMRVHLYVSDKVIHYVYDVAVCLSVCLSRGNAARALWLRFSQLYRVFQKYSPFDFWS